VGVAKIANKIASKEIFCYGSILFLLEVGLLGFCYARKKFYARNVCIKPAPTETKVKVFGLSLWSELKTDPKLSEMTHLVEYVF